jgi:hypothetical protein
MTNVPSLLNSTTDLAAAGILPPDMFHLPTTGFLEQATNNMGQTMSHANLRMSRYTLIGTI